MVRFEIWFYTDTNVSMALQDYTTVIITICYACALEDDISNGSNLGIMLARKLGL